MKKTSGIYSQFGFLFQRRVFLFYVLENLSKLATFVYEGEDDVEKISSLRFSSEHKYMQVKTGENVDKNCFCKIVSNWLLNLETNNPHFTLFAEKKLDFEPSDAFCDIHKFISSGKGKRIDSIARRTYDKFKPDNSDSKTLETSFKKVIDNLNVEILSMEDLHSKTFTIFCRD